MCLCRCFLHRCCRHRELRHIWFHICLILHDRWTSVDHRDVSASRMDVKSCRTSSCSPVYIVQAQHKSGPPMQGSRRNASIYHQCLRSTVLDPHSMEESSKHTQIAAPPSLVGVWQQWDPIGYVQKSMKWGQTLELHGGHCKASNKH